jgi:radical SAM protein with 4Fe4S-binding SPASM domain
MLNKVLQLGKYEIWKAQREASRKVHKLTYLFWEVSLSCNFHCRHCGSNCERKQYQDDLTTEEIKKVFREISEDYDVKKITIAVTGGEPLLRKDVFEVMGYARSLGFHWGMVTNGWSITPEVVEKMKESGMETIVVSIDGLKETHDRFRDMPGSFDRAANGVKSLAQAKFLKDLQITTSVHRQCFGELEEMYKLFSTLGITSWRVMNVDPIGRAEIDKEILLTSEELKKLLSFIKEKRKKCPFKISYSCDQFLGFDYDDSVRDQPFYCGTGINIGSILQNGDIFVCPNVPRLPELIQGNIKKDRFSDVWENKFELFRDPKRTACEKCLQCSDWEYCLGGSFHLWDFENKKPKCCYRENN